MSEENKVLARRWFEELFNAQNLEVADKSTAQAAVSHDPLLTALPSGPEGDKYVVTSTTVPSPTPRSRLRTR